MSSEIFLYDVEAGEVDSQHQGAYGQDPAVRQGVRDSHGEGVEEPSEDEYAVDLAPAVRYGIVLLSKQSTDYKHGEIAGKMSPGSGVI